MDTNIEGTLTSAVCIHVHWTGQSIHEVGAASGAQVVPSFLLIRRTVHSSAATSALPIAAVQPMDHTTLEPYDTSFQPTRAYSNFPYIHTTPLIHLL